MTRHLLLYALLTLLPLTLHAATPVVKNVVVAPDSMYEDVINLPFDDKGVDITVHMTFDEDANILTLAISGTRRLFVFEGDTYIRQAFRGKWFGRKRLYPERLRYPVLVQPKTRYLLSRQVRKSYRKPRSQHLFNRWIDYSRELKTIVPNTFPLAQDSIVRQFEVHPSATKASVTLRNILVVDPDGGFAAIPVAIGGKTAKYEFVADNDMALTYNLTLRRNPCFGMEAMTDSIRNAANQVEEAYQRLMKTSPKGNASSNAEVDVFNQHKQYLLSQYQPIALTTNCPELTAQIERYNHYVDSISTSDCQYESAADKMQEKVSKLKNKVGINAKVLLHAARNLDNITAKILSCKDPVQKHDLIAEGRGIVSSTSASIKQSNAVNAEQKSALLVYRRAEQYFEKTTR